MFANRLIEDGSFSSDAHGFSFVARLNWYRALPLSSIRIDVALDGMPVDPDAIVFTVDGMQYSPAELVEHDDLMWFVTDPGVVRVDRPGGLAPGDHELSLMLTSRIPYVPTRPPDVLLEADRCTTTVSV